LVAEPERVLSECARVTKPGGEIIVVSHLYSEHGLSAAVERWLARRSRSIGLRPDFPFSRLAAWAQHHGGIDLVERTPIQPLGIHPGAFPQARGASDARRGIPVGRFDPQLTGRSVPAPKP